MQDNWSMPGASAQDKLPIAIVSDVVCPWCFIGKARLDAALAEHGLTDRVAITWLPYELNPDMPAEGVRGNSHMIMMDTNSDDVARRINAWMAGQGLMRDPPARPRRREGNRPN